MIKKKLIYTPNKKYVPQQKFHLIKLVTTKILPLQKSIVRDLSAEI